MQQDNISEIVDSLQSQYIEVSGCFYGTASLPQSPSTNPRLQADEYIPESPIPPEYPQRGEWDDVNTQQPGPVCDQKADLINRCSSHRQYSAEINNVSELLSHPNTPGVGLSSNVSEIAETPVQPSSLGTDFSCPGSYPFYNTPSHNNLTFGSCGSILRGSFTCKIKFYILFTFCSHSHRLRVRPVNLSELNSGNSLSKPVTAPRRAQC